MQRLRSFIFMTLVACGEEAPDPDAETTPGETDASDDSAWPPCDDACDGVCAGDFCCPIGAACGEACCEFATNRVIAHRGAWRLSGLPENSVAALRHAVDLGCEGSEFDVWMTADDVLVVNHDPTFFDLPIEESTYEDLLAEQLSNGEPIPTVEEMLLEGMTQVTTKLIYEIKPSQVDDARSLELAERSVELVHELGAQDWVSYISFDYDILLRILELDPDARVAYLDGSIGPEQLHEDGFHGAAYHFVTYQQNPEWIDDLKALGLTINAWTVNTMGAMQWLIDADVDYITTDEPELLMSLGEASRARDGAPHRNALLGID